MSPGPDGDDDELVDIELELDGPPPSPAEAARAVRDKPASPPPSPAGVESDVEVPEIIELRQPIVEAAEADARADLSLYELEAAAAEEPGRRAALLVEVVRLSAPELALDAARRAFAADPKTGVALWRLRRLLAAAERWQELADAYAAAAAAGSAAAAAEPPSAAAGSAAAAAEPPSAVADKAAAADRADLLVERGRVLEDRLDRDLEAAASYSEALAVAPDHVGALLALLLFGARRPDPASMATALEGLARRADDGTRRAALAIEAARCWRLEGDGSEGAVRALGVLEAELDRGDDTTPIGTLLVELETLTGRDAPANVAAQALAHVARRAAPHDPAFAVGIWRERSRLLARDAGGAEAALEALDEAARLDPSHPLVAAARLELAETIGRGDAVDGIAREIVDAARTDDEAVDFALLHAGIALRAGRDAAAMASLEAPRVRARKGERVDLRAFELALIVRKRDQAALANAFLGEAGALAGQAAGDDLSAASALAAAGALWQWALGNAGLAEEMYRRALALEPAHRPALQALVALLGGGDRGAETAELLEAALEATADGGAEIWVRGMLVSIYADELGQPARALPHQRRLVALAPEDVGRRVRLHDLELGGTLGVGPLEVETLLALAERAVDPAVAIALRVGAGRGLVGADGASAARGLALLEQLTPDDPTGLAAAARERAAPSAEVRAEVVASELATTTTDTPAERVRALRFRLANHHAAGGRYAEALAALTPLRSDGDPLARAWSYELARRSGEAILEVAVLSEEIRTSDAVLGEPIGVLLAHGEALARAGDPSGAAMVLRRVLAAAPKGPTAVEAALALFRIAASDPRPGSDALPEALRALADACADDAGFAEGAVREEALQRAAAGMLVPSDLELPVAPDAPARVRAETALVRFVAGARLGDPRALAAALVDMALLGGDGPIPDDIVPLLGRAAARARLGGADVADEVARRVWNAAHPAGLAPALSDLAIPAGGLWPEGRPDPRRARARRTGGATGLALELEVALEAERRGALGTALGAYGSVIAIDPERFEAWTGIRRVARAGGDLLGEARALARLGALVRDSDRAAALLAEAASAYERAERPDDAITTLAKAVELRPGDPVAFERVYSLLRADIDAPGHATLFDNLLSHRLAAVPLPPGERVALIYERAQHRLERMGDREAAVSDLNQILNIVPGHLEALHQLARVSIEDGDGRAAVHWLERFLATAGDDPRAGAARLDLAAAYEQSKERGRAVETLRRAAGARPADPTPLHRLADLQLRLGDWRSAIEALRASEPRLPEVQARAAVHQRIGIVLRDLGRDPAGAAASFRRASDLDPLGDGTRELVALHDAAQDPAGALETVQHELSSIRRGLATTPLDERLLERLGEFLATARTRGAPGPIAEAEAAVVSVLGLVRGAAELVAPPGRFAPKSATAFWTELVHPAAGGFVTEIWSNLAEAAAELYPAAAARDRRVAADGPFEWIEATAATLGLPGLHLYVMRDKRRGPVMGIDGPTPGLWLAPGAERTPGFRFHVGRALGLLVQRATILERASADDLGPLFACASVLAEAAPPAGLSRPTEDVLRTVTRALGRKQRKALALQASRFGFETFDLPAWHGGVLRTAERLGLLVAGDVATAAVALGGGDRTAVADSQAALELVVFALGDRYPALHRAARGER